MELDYITRKGVNKRNQSRVEYTKSAAASIKLTAAANGELYHGVEVDQF